MHCPPSRAPRGVSDILARDEALPHSARMQRSHRPDPYPPECFAPCDRHTHLRLVSIWLEASDPTSCSNVLRVTPVHSLQLAQSMTSLYIWPWGACQVPRRV